MKYIIILLFVINFGFSQEQKDIESIFKAKNIEGTLVISSIKSKKTFVYNEQRAKKRFTPASTFKIPNTLIALKEGIVDDENSSLKWDGKIREYEMWNKDQTLKSAFSNSCVWCYEEFAKELDNDDYLKYLARMNYGNKLTNEKYDTFWINGDLEISAFEQIEFLKNLYIEKLPFPKNVLKTGKRIFIEEENENYTLSAKTGWNGKIGWYVGYVKNKDDIWVFALNANIKREDLNKRKQIVMEALKVKNII